MKDEHLAKAAYVAYAESKNWTDAGGQRLPQFRELDEPAQSAWAAAADSVLKQWLERDLRTSLFDGNRLMKTFLVPLLIGMERRVGQHMAVAAAISSYLVELIDPQAPQRYQIEKDTQI